MRPRTRMDDGFALLAVGFLGGFLDAHDGFVFGEDTRKFEEARLHDRVDAIAHAGLFGNGVGVDDVQLDLLVDDFLLRLGRNVIPGIVGGIRAVHEERGADFGIGQNVAFLDKTKLMHGDEVRALNQIRTLDRLLAKTEVRNRLATGFLRVINEIALRVERGVLADDLDGVLVGADGAVAAVSIKDSASIFGIFGDEGRIPRQRMLGQVVVDTDGEVILGGVLLELIEDGLGHGGGEFLRNSVWMIVAVLFRNAQYARRSALCPAGIRTFASGYVLDLRSARIRRARVCDKIY